MLENSMIGYISIGSYRIKGDDWQFTTDLVSF